MATGEVIGCFGLTEADFGSDPNHMRTSAKRDGDDWVLNGSKMWITNGSIADVAVIWAQTDDGIRGFLVPDRHAGVLRERHPSQAVAPRERDVGAGARRRARSRGRGAPTSRG